MTESVSGEGGPEGERGGERERERKKNYNQPRQS